jgi:glycosyltransferase involved in cell wall biosynthesis
MRVNLTTWDNGVGLSRDLELLGDVLSKAGLNVSYTRRGRGKLRKLGRPFKVNLQTAWQTLRYGAGKPRFDLNILLEHVWPEYRPWARNMVFIPNPEWCSKRDVAELGNMDLVLAKTRETERIFNALGRRTSFTGFTSADRNDSTVARERAFFHLAGRSQNKGTENLLALWRRHPQWPTLTVVQSPRTAQVSAPAPNIRHIVDYLDDNELKALQNAHRFHLCPSETEGFGHYIVEAMSVGAVVLTLDAAPMNELVQPERGILVVAMRIGEQNLATTYTFDETAMIAAVERMIGLGEEELDRYAKAARKWYEVNHAGFGPRLLRALDPFEDLSVAVDER